MHVDDFLYAGSQNFKKCVVYKMMQKYEMGKHQGSNFKYVTIEITQTTEGIKEVPLLAILTRNIFSNFFP